jgi:hypothetical protein
VFFTLSTVQLVLMLAAIMFGATILGYWAGRRMSHKRDVLREPVGVVQGALLTLVALVLAFGLAMAVGRHDARRTAVVDDANAIGTAYLRAQTLPEPQRSRSLPLFAQYTRESVDLSRTVPGSAAQERAIDAGSDLQRRMWRQASQALSAEPAASAPRLYVESLNDMIDMQTTRVAALNNRVPFAIVFFEVLGAATALALLAFFLALLSRGIVAALLTASMLTLLLLISFDLDRPTRGLIEIPVSPLESLERSMTLPPASDAPRPPHGGEHDVPPRQSAG